MTMRIKCQVLQFFAINGPCTVEKACLELPHLTQKKISSAVRNLIDQDRMFKDGETATGNKFKPTVFKYSVRDDWEPPAKPKRTDSSNSLNHNKALQRSHDTNNFSTVLVRFREQKTSLIRRLVSNHNGTERDLLIGILADYGHKYEAKP